MDEWQKSLYKRLKEHVGDSAETTPPKTDSPMIGINEVEAYVLMKALEAQEKFEHPALVLKENLLYPSSNIPPLI